MIGKPWGSPLSSYPMVSTGVWTDSEPLLAPACAKAQRTPVKPRTRAVLARPAALRNVLRLGDMESPENNRRWRSPSPSKATLQPGIPIVATIGPVIGGAGICEVNCSDPLDVLDAIFDGSGQSQWRSMLGRQWPAIYFVAEQCLRMSRTLDIQAHIVNAVRSFKTHIARIRTNFINEA